MLVRLPLARRQLALSLATVATIGAIVASALVAVRAAHAARPSDPSPSLKALRGLVDHYRTVTWTFEQAAHVPRVPSTYTERRTRDRAYLRWAIDRWTRRAYIARSQAIRSLHSRFAVKLPDPPALRAPLPATLSYSRRLALRLRGIYPGRVSRAFADARGPNGRAVLRTWQLRSAVAALAVSQHAERRAAVPAWLVQALTCIHHYEAAWNANTGNGYYGGLQMDVPFQSAYGAEYLQRYGTADRWPVWAQLEVAARAYRSGRGFWPWPNTARACGLL
ncbi:MAG TPA: hypothetical protein VLV46_16230 [Gaiellaceae bacterium]|nr:hypothetical protein [Gaiellaceae bacterium]